MSRINIKAQIVTFLLVVMVAHGVYSQITGEDIIGHGIPSVSLTNIAQTELTPQPDGALNQELRSGKVFVELFLADNSDLGIEMSSAYTYSVDFDLSFQNDGGVLPPIQSGTVDITEKKPKQVFVLNVDETQYNLLDEIQLNITGTTNSGSMDVVTYVLDKVRIKLRYELNFGRDVRTANNPATNLATSIEAITPSAEQEITNRIQQFQWKDDGYQFPMYQFQLLRLYNTNDAKVTSESNIETIIDWSNALTIETEETSLRITIGEGTGFYVWRVRPIGTFYEGGITNPQNYGNWNINSPLQGEELEISLSSVGGAGSESPYFFFRDPDEAINWIYSRIFTEDNKVSEQMTYAGGLLHTKQSQAYLSTNDQTLTTQSMQDYSGRTAITTLPVPDAGGLNGYKNSIAQNNSVPYSPENFDTETTFDQPEAFDQGGLFSYYSNSSTEANVPDAEGYPYTRTLFSNDGTNRVIEQSGVGKMHAIGTTTDKGKTVKTLFGTPSEGELIRIFGDEAPDPTTVFKTITIDQNSTRSVTYTSKEGQVIATSLSSISTDGLPDAAASGVTTSFQVRNSITRNTQLPTGFISSKRVAIPNQVSFDNLDLKYSVRCSTIVEGCIGVDNEDCPYELIVRIYSLDNGTVYESAPIDVKAVSCSGGDKTVEFSTVSGNLLHDKNNTGVTLQSLPAGNYIFEKCINIDPNDLSSLQDSITSITSGIDPLINWVTSEIRSINESNYQTRLTEVQDEVQMMVIDFDAAKASNDFTTFKSSYSLGTMEDSELKKLSLAYSNPELGINPGCCTPYSIAIEYEPPFECPTQSELNDVTPPDGIATFETTDKIDFEAYLAERVQAGVNYLDLLPGYRAGDFNAMIYHMLTDEYSCQPGGTAEVQYECEELWSCWVTAVGTYEDMVNVADAANRGDESDEGTSNDGGIGEDDPDEDNAVAKGIDEETDDGVDEDADGDDLDDSNELNETTNEAAEEGADEEGPGALVQWFVNRKMAKVLREDVEMEPVIINLAEMFLQCTGYRFASILHTPTASSTDFVNSDIDEYNNYRTDPEETLFDDEGELVYPYIYAPVFAFKYYEYNGDLSRTDDDNEEKLYVHFNVELQNCYRDEIEYLNHRSHPASVSTLCNTSCTTNHGSWTCNERLNFYLALKASPIPDPTLFAKMQVTESLNDIFKLGLSTNPCNDFDLSTMEDMQDLRIDDCKDACTQRATKIEEEVSKWFEDNCYEIGTCPDDNTVTQDEIDAIVSDIVADCRNSCSSAISSSPTCANEDCLVIEIIDNGSGFSDYQLVPIRTANVTLFTECEEATLDQLSYWDFSFRLNDIDGNTNINYCGSSPAQQVAPADAPNWIHTCNSGGACSGGHNACNTSGTNQPDPTTSIIYEASTTP